MYVIELHMWCDWETIPKVRKYKSELRAKTSFRVKFGEIEVMIDSCRNQFIEFEKTSPGLRE